MLNKKNRTLSPSRPAIANFFSHNFLAIEFFLAYADIFEGEACYLQHNPRPLRYAPTIKVNQLQALRDLWDHAHHLPQDLDMDCSLKIDVAIICFEPRKNEATQLHVASFSTDIPRTTSHNRET